MKYQQSKFSGGISAGSRSGYSGAYQDGIGVDIRTDPDNVTALRRMSKESGSTVTGLVKWMVEYNSDIWMYDDTGKIYKRTSTPVYTNPKTVANSTGQGIAIFNTLNEDSLWYANATNVGRATDLTTTPATFSDNYFVSKTSEASITTFPVTVANSYTTPTAISETSANKYTFTAVDTSLTGIVVRLIARGTGNVTVTLHDASNVEITSVTITNANLPSAANQNVRFMMDGIGQVTIGSSYHIHITSTVADATVTVLTASDLSTLYATTLTDYNSTDVDTESEFALPVVGTPTYSLPAAISESAVNKLTFQPNRSWIKAISVCVIVKSTGDWTMTLHDANNVTLGTVTVTNATLKERYAFYRFEFTNPIAVNPTGDYHIHLTSPVANAQILTSTTNDLSTAAYKIHSPILLNDADYHPMKEFVNVLCIGNGNHLATIDNLEQYDPERLTFAKGERVRALEVIGGSLFIATWRGTSIGDYETSKLYTWDGISANWNDVIEISGQVNALKNAGNNMLYVRHGIEGDLSLYTGGITPIRVMKYLGKNKSVETYPGCVTVHNKIFYYGISNGTSTTADRVVYGYGTKNKDYPVAWTKDYITSTGRYGSTVQHGCYLGTNATTFLISWKDGSTYGVDCINSNQDQQDVYITGLAFDKPEIHQQKESKSLSIRHDPLSPDQTIEVWYKRDGLDEVGGPDEPIDSEGFKLLGTADGQADSTSYYTAFPFDERWFQLEVKVRLKTTGPNSPTFYSWEVVFDEVDDTQLGVKNEHE